MVSPVVGFALVFTCLFSVALGWAIGVADRRRRAKRDGTAAHSSLDQIAAVLAGLESDLKAQCAETERARAERDEQARKANEYYRLIDGVVKEATDCRTLLVRTGAEHGNAQAMMIAEIDSLAFQYRGLVQQFRTATGKLPPRPEPRLNSTIQAVANDFREAHVTPYQEPTVATPVQAVPQPGG